MTTKLDLCGREDFEPESLEWMATAYESSADGIPIDGDEIEYFDTLEEAQAYAQAQAEAYVGSSGSFWRAESRDGVPYDYGIDAAE